MLMYETKGQQDVDIKCTQESRLSGWLKPQDFKFSYPRLKLFYEQPLAQPLTFTYMKLVCLSSECIHQCASFILLALQLKSH